MDDPIIRTSGGHVTVTDRRSENAVTQDDGTKAMETLARAANTGCRRNKRGGTAPGRKRTASALSTSGKC